MNASLRRCAGELVGTFILTAIGTSSVAVALFTPLRLSLWQVAAIWGAGVALAIYATRGLSGAHLNPAVTLALAVCRPETCPSRRVAVLWAMQLLGAMAAGALVLAVFGERIEVFEEERGLLRGMPGSELSAMAFGEYFPNPAMYGTGPEARAMVPPLLAAAVEGLGTAVLVLVIFAVSDDRWALRLSDAAPIIIGGTVAVLIYLFAPVTQAGWNPARDLGPRLVAWAAGWGAIAVPGPAGGFWVYVAGPMVGALLGGGAYRLINRSGPRC